MLIYDNNILENESKNNYIALGSFDGLHLGHLSLVEKVKKLAKQNNGLSIVFTFKNHPKKFINPNSDIKLIMNNDEKIKVLEKENIESRQVWKPMHIQPVFKDYKFFSSLDEKSIAEDLFNRGICLPSDTKMNEDDIDKIISIVKSLFK